MRRAANLVGAAVVTAALMVNGFRFWLLEVVNVHGDDFRFYYAMARVGLTYGWSHIYDLNLQCAPIGPISETAKHCPGLDLPPVAWFATVFTVLPYTNAYPIWVAFLGLCLVAIVILPWQGYPEPKAMYAVAAFTLFPVAYCLFLGQVTMVAVLGVVAAWWLLRRERPHLAGLALVLTLAKPQTVLLVPVALAVAGRWRTIVVFAALCAGLLVISLATLGVSGVSAYLSLTNAALGGTVNYVYTLAGLVGRPVGTVLQCVLALVALVTAWRFRAHLETVVIAGLLGSALFSPYWHVADYVVLVPAAALQLSREPRLPATLLACALFVVGSPLLVGATFVPSVIQVGSWLALEVAWLLWLASRPAQSLFADGRHELIARQPESVAE
ncbi:MAG TPA: glycosyltransferase family 87 protein [Candidatus Sulfotelmatobacter sp.]|nr:glycosyltransferase family 87 protein [Candidatus Sulfotelmatobacter sp.]